MLFELRDKRVEFQLKYILVAQQGWQYFPAKILNIVNLKLRNGR